MLQASSYRLLRVPITFSPLINYLLPLTILPITAYQSPPFTYYLPIPYLCGTMKLVDVLLLSLAAVFVIIGIYEVMTLGIGHAYWAIMLSFGFFFLYTYRKKK
jgi:hypothetical protein